MTDYGYAFLFQEQYFFATQVVRKIVSASKKRAKICFGATDDLLIDEVILITGGFVE